MLATGAMSERSECLAGCGRCDEISHRTAGAGHRHKSTIRRRRALAMQDEITLPLRQVMRIVEDFPAIGAQNRKSAACDDLTIEPGEPQGHVVVGQEIRAARVQEQTVRTAQMMTRQHCRTKPARARMHQQCEPALGQAVLVGGCRIHDLQHALELAEMIATTDRPK